MSKHQGEIMKVGKMHVEEFELAPEESINVDERVTKYKERVARSRKVLLKKVLYLPSFVTFDIISNILSVVAEHLKVSTICLVF